MKLSLAFSALILAVAASIAWQDHERLTQVRAIHAKLVAEAAALGISPDVANAAASSRITKRERAQGRREADAKQAAAEFIAFAQEMEAAQKKGGPPDEKVQERIMGLMDRMMSLDAGQLKIVISTLRDDPTLNDEMRRNLIGFSIMTLASDHPQAALGLFTESSDLFKNDGMGRGVISSSLAKWAKDDPTAALDWIRKNGEKYPDLVTDDAKEGLIAGAAEQDPRMAFRLIGELGLENASGAGQAIVRAARTPEERTVSLAALREYLSTLPEGKDRDLISRNAINELGGKAAKDGFEAGSQWIKSAGFSPEEIVRMANYNFVASGSDGDTGKWIAWVGESGSPGKNAVQSMVRQWAENDYQAAGKWLATAPPGPTKDAAVRSYAETLASYEPESAAQWALTLPPGTDRTETLQSIYEHWPNKDEESKQAATAFAKAHGLK
jgi:hypothetical protein